MAATMPPQRVDLTNVIPGPAFDFVGQRFDEIGAAQWIRRVGHAGFVRDDLLGAQRECGGKLGRQRPSFVQRIGVQRLRAAHHGGESLQRGADHIVVRLLCCQRAARGLRMESQRRGTLRLRAEPLSHRFVPDAARGAILGDFLEEVIVRVEKERKPWREFVDIEAAPQTPFHIFDSVAQCESKFLDRRGARFADVVGR